MTNNFDFNLHQDIMSGFFVSPIFTTMDRILDGLNDEQRDGVTTIDGPVLILAGAGSGKTKVLTHRISYIFQEKNIGYENILAATFTNKAAAEMKQRIAKLLDLNIDTYYGRNLLPFMGTFHSICVKILRADGLNVGVNPNFVIYDTSDQQDVIKEVLKKINLATKDFSPSAILSAISSAKNELQKPNEFEKFAQGYFLQTVARIYHEYQKTLVKNSAMDFDDIIMYTAELFEKNPEVLKKYQTLFQYILVDEYQDTNHAQYKLVNLMAAGHRNICVVGDPDQSIYSFRGADISNILSFEKDYPEAKVIKLEQNYRSTKNILDAAQNVIEKNKNRKDKKLISNKGVGTKITIYEALNEMDESRFITRKISEYLRDNYATEKPLNEISVLYRTNAQSRGLEEQMIRDGIPYKLVGGLRFYDRKEIKDLLCYLKMIYNPDDNSALKRIINTPVRGIGPKAFSDLVESADQSGVSSVNLLLMIAEFDLKDIDEIKLDDPALAKIASNKNIFSFAQKVKLIFDKAQKLPPAELLEFIIETVNYISYIDDKTPESESRKENIKELFSVAEKYSELDPVVGLTEFLTEVALVEQESASVEDSVKGAVTLMTIHAAKGLEFSSVFIVGLEEGLFPHSRVFTDPTELEEERRLAYVAITRAKANLYMIYASQRMIYGKISANPASRFLADIPEELITFTTANRDKKFAEKKKYNDFDDFSSDFAPSTSKFTFGNPSHSLGRGNLDNKNVVPDVFESNSDEYLEIGDNVEHKIFGRGQIIGADESIISVRFDTVGVKKLSREYAHLIKAK